MRRTIALLLAASLLAVAGCGDDDDEDGGSAATTEAPAAETAPADTGAAKSAGTTEKVVLTDFKIDPADPNIKPGKVTFDVVNDGSAPHALEIDGQGVEEKTATLNGGDSAKLEADLKAGEYEWYCPVGNHRELGMEGTLTVGDGSGGSSSGGGSATGY